MKHEIVLVNNVKRTLQAATALTQPGTEQRICIWHGPAGLGKTTAAEILTTKQQAVYVRALAVWTPTAMLAAICAELQINDNCTRKWQMVQNIMRSLEERPRPIIVDEADHIAGDPKNIETLRDVHDMCGVPIVLIGMEGLVKSLRRRPQVAQRVGAEIIFQPLNHADATQVAKQLCEVQLAEDLIDKLFKASQGSIRSFKVGLASIEQRAKTLQLPVIGTKEWGDKPFFFAQSTARGIAKADDAPASGSLTVAA
ncbi:ATP-binding protein [Ferrovibrio terrae]|uniref:ATP-binding protein n=1 Tax=Ferrovibrio terrae TaxID=2594003 RepID=UPI003137E7E8